MFSINQARYKSTFDFQNNYFCRETRRHPGNDNGYYKILGGGLYRPPVTRYFLLTRLRLPVSV